MGQNLCVVPLFLQLLIHNVCLFSCITLALCSARYIFSASPCSRSEIWVCFKLVRSQLSLSDKCSRIQLIIGSTLKVNQRPLLEEKRRIVYKQNFLRNLINSIYLTPCSCDKITHVIKLFKFLTLFSVPALSCTALPKALQPSSRVWWAAILIQKRSRLKSFFIAIFL